MKIGMIGLRYVKLPELYVFTKVYSVVGVDIKSIFSLLDGRL